jgi:hypothetical protein
MILLSFVFLRPRTSSFNEIPQTLDDRLNSPTQLPSFLSQSNGHTLSWFNHYCARSEVSYPTAVLVKEYKTPTCLTPHPGIMLSIFMLQ